MPKATPIMQAKNHCFWGFEHAQISLKIRREIWIFMG
jgi:hypothetical protein